ncbi:hypothetical protein WDU94_015555 [Cyamophila willieti]
MTTLGTLFDQPTTDPFLERVKDVIRNKFPEGWRDWTLTECAPSFSHVHRYKLRFALPSLEVVREFTNADHISERSYKKLLSSLLDWPLGQALVLAPADFSSAYRPSKAAYERFLADTSGLKPLILSRKEINSALKKPPGQIERQQLDPVNSRLEKFENSFTEFQNSIVSLLSDTRRNLSCSVGNDTLPPTSFPADSAPGDYRGSDNGSLASFDNEDALSDGEVGDPWNPPVIELSPAPIDTSDFDPVTIEQEPDIPEAPELLRKQLLRCQALNSSNWDRIRYAEAESELKHAAPFQPLSGNLALHCSNKEADFFIRKMERMACNFQYGLLSQREEFQAARREMIKHIPTSEPFFRSLFTGEETGFRKTSFNMLQFTSLGILFDLPSDETINKVKPLIANLLPEGWKDWKVQERILEPLSVQKNLRNKIRFAIPTVELLQEVFPEETHVGSYKFPQNIIRIKKLVEDYEEQTEEFRGEIHVKNQKLDNLNSNLKKLEKHLKDEKECNMQLEKEKENIIEDKSRTIDTLKKTIETIRTKKQECQDETKLYDSINHPDVTLNTVTAINQNSTSLNITNDVETILRGIDNTPVARAPATHSELPAAETISPAIAQPSSSNVTSAESNTNNTGRNVFVIGDSHCRELGQIIKPLLEQDQRVTCVVNPGRRLDYIVSSIKPKSIPKLTNLFDSGY